MNGCKVIINIIFSLLEDRQQDGWTRDLIGRYQALALVIALKVFLRHRGSVLGLQERFHEINKTNVADLAQVAWRLIYAARG